MSSLVTVVIPTRNRQSTLKETVKSVLHQTFRNFEVIIVDNNSSDNTEKYCHSLMKLHNNIHYYRNNTNLGMVGNWNRGLSLAKGKYVSLLMDDDIWEKDFLKNTVSVLEKNPDVGFTCVWIDIIRDGKIAQDSRYRLFDRCKKQRGYDCLRQYLNDKWLVGLPSGILFRNNVQDKFDPIGLDPEFWFRFCVKYNFYYIDKKQCLWTEGASSYTSSTNFKDYVFKRQYLIDRALDCYKSSRGHRPLENMILRYKAYSQLSREVFSMRVNNGKYYSKLSLRLEALFLLRCGKYVFMKVLQKIFK